MIRQANKFDFPQIIEMLHQYKKESPIKCLQNSNDEQYVLNLLNNIVALNSGFILVAEKETKIIGMIIAGIVPNIWNPIVKQCSEIAYWVNKDARGGTAAYRLIKTYIEECEKLKRQGTIQFFTISKMVNSPDLKYSKCGFEKLEETWVK
jgi:predicted acetyltransferase